MSRCGHVHGAAEEVDHGREGKANVTRQRHGDRVVCDIGAGDRDGADLVGRNAVLCCVGRRVGDCRVRVVRKHPRSGQGGGVGGVLSVTPLVGHDADVEDQREEAYQRDQRQREDDGGLS